MENTIANGEHTHRIFGIWDSGYLGLGTGRGRMITLMRELQLILLCCTLFLSIRGQFVTWTKEHEQCTQRISSSVPSPVLCEKLPYYSYFQGLLASKTDEFHKNIATAVLGLYSDLAEARKPYLFTHPQNASRTLLIHPITFCIPEENILSTVPHKAKPFGRVIPGIQSTYYHLHNESAYFEDMARSLFTITYKKGGWDCLRHYEILAAGSLPLFMQIRLCPAHALAFHPKRLYALILTTPGLNVQAKRTGQMTMQFDTLQMDLAQLDHGLYNALVSSLLHYTKQVLSTKGMAAYVLETMLAHSQGKIPAHPRSVLYLTHQDRDMDKGDYMTDFLLHGLKRLLGEAAVEDFPVRDGLYKTTSAFNTTNYLEQRSQLYGAGFSWGMKMEALSSNSQQRDKNDIQRRLASHQYDIVILGSGHRDGWAAKLFFWDLVCKHYHPLQVGFVDGADYHLRLKTLDKYSQCAGHFFSREGYEKK